MQAARILNVRGQACLSFGLLPHFAAMKRCLSMSQPTPPDQAAVDAYMRAAAKALALPLDQADANAVKLNLTIAFNLAPLFMGFALPDDAEPGPVFKP